MKKHAEHFPIAAYLFFGLALAGAMLLCVCAGSVAIPLGDTVTVLWNSLWGLESPAGMAKNIILNVRLPRVLNVALCGAALSLCGAAMQGLLRNPLADGSTLGVSAGASLGAVIALALGICVMASVVIVPALADEESAADDLPETVLESAPEPETTPEPTPTAPVIANDGDVDGDGMITVQDALAVMRNAMALVEFTEEQTIRGDIDGNGVIAVADAIVIMRISLGLLP